MHWFFFFAVLCASRSTPRFSAQTTSFVSLAVLFSARVPTCGWIGSRRCRLVLWLCLCLLFTVLATLAACRAFAPISSGRFFLTLPATRCYAPVIASLVSPWKFLSLCCCAYWVVSTFPCASLFVCRVTHVCCRDHRVTTRSSALELLGGCRGILACVAIIELSCFL